MLTAAMLWACDDGGGGSSPSTADAQDSSVEQGDAAPQGDLASPDVQADLPAEDTAPGDAPAEEEGGAGALAVGSACTEGDACPEGGSGTASCLTDWPDGYCAVVGCEAHGHDCPDDPGLGGDTTSGSKCVLAPEAMCLQLCVTDDDCRDGYSCTAEADSAGHGSVTVCFPTE